MAAKAKSKVRVERSAPPRLGGRRTTGAHRDLPEFDRLIHERIRLGMVSALAVNDSLSFNDLKRVLKTTDGNLSVHARKLEEAGYVRCSKFFDGRIPRTEYRLLPPGRKAFEEYLDQMAEFIGLSR